MFAQVAAVTELTLKNNQSPAATVVVHPVKVEEVAVVAVVTVGFAEAVMTSAIVGG